MWPRAASATLRSPRIKLRTCLAGAFVPKPPRRLCISTRVLLRAAMPALHCRRACPDNRIRHGRAAAGGLRLGDRVIVRGRGVARLLPREGDRTQSTQTKWTVGCDLVSGYCALHGPVAASRWGIDQRTVASVLCRSSLTALPRRTTGRLSERCPRGALKSSFPGGVRERRGRLAADDRRGLVDERVVLERLHHE
jgi:hypothetical protein